MTWPILFLLVMSLGLMFLRVPIAFSLLFAGLGVVFLWGLPHTSAPISIVRTLDVWAWAAIPLFILVGYLMNSSGMTPRLIDFSRAALGHLPGGLSHTVVGTNILMAGISGSMAADLTASGILLIPAMKKEGYSPGYACGIVGASSMIGPLIPPSLPFVMFGVLSGASIVRLFLAGVFPGLLLGIGLIIGGYVIAKKRGYPCYPRPPIRTVSKLGLWAVPALALPVIIIGGMRIGMYTPTEAAAIAVVYTLLVGLAVYRGLGVKKVYSSFLETAKLTGAIMLLVGVSGVMSADLAYFQFGPWLTGVLTSTIHSPAMFLVGTILIVLVLGTVLDATAIQIIFTPLLAPIALAYHVDLVYFGVVYCYAILIGLLTPPYGLGMFILMRISNITMKDYVKGVMFHLCIVAAVLVLIAAIPALTLYLPNLVYGK